jgi:hypothetical protein
VSTAGSDGIELHEALIDTHMKSSGILSGQLTGAIVSLMDYHGGIPT